VTPGTTADRFLILTEDRCRNTFCWTASARCRLVGPEAGFEDRAPDASVAQVCELFSE